MINHLYKLIIESVCVILFFSIIDLLIYILIFKYILYLNFFYTGLLGVGVSAIVNLLLSIFLHTFFYQKSIFFLRQSIFPSAFASVILLYSFHITFPTVIDRSISLYILSRMQNNFSGLDLDDIQNSFAHGYINNYDAVCRRLDEQLQLGNIVFVNNKYLLSRDGDSKLLILNKIAKIVGQNNYYIENKPPFYSPYMYNISNGQCLLVNK